MIKSSYLNQENRHSIDRALSWKNIRENIWFGHMVIWVIPAIMIGLDLATKGSSRVFTLLVMIPYSLFILLFGLIAWDTDWLLVHLWWDWKINKKIKETEGLISSKRGVKTFGMLIDEYTIKIGGKTGYYIDRELYSKIKVGDKIKIKYLANSKVVTEYEI